MGNAFPAHERTSNTPYPHQDRVNVEMFRAIEALGRKLERVEGERERLSRRLALIESAATVDEETGKLYLPVVVDQAQLPQVMYPSSGASTRWVTALSMMSSVLALFAVGLVLFRTPVQNLTPQQMAALEALTAPQFAKTESRTWKSIDPVAEEMATVKANLPDSTRLAMEERLAEKPAPAVETVEDILGPPDRLTVVDSMAVEPSLVAEPLDVTQVHIPGEDKPEKKVDMPDILPEKEVAQVPVVPPSAVEETSVAEKPKVVAKKEEAKPAPTAKKEAVAEKKPVPVVEGISPDKNLPEKLAELEKRAFDGVPEAQHDLATLYASGKLAAQDFKRAVYWFSKASEGGIANADYNLGVMFQQGLGVKMDLAKSIGWYTKAAQLGHPEAMYNLGIAYIEGIGTGKDIDRGISYFKQAANAGVAQAAYNLGVLYESGFMGPVDAEKAQDWYQVAVNNGHADAGEALERLKVAGMDDRGLTLSEMVEPASGEGDASPVDEDIARFLPPPGSGSKNSLTGKIQQALIDKGYLPGETPTGQMDPQTEDAIRAFQKKAGLPVDGEPTALLLERMQSLD